MTYRMVFAVLMPYKTLSIRNKTSSCNNNVLPGRRAGQNLKDSRLRSDETLSKHKRINDLWKMLPSRMLEYLLGLVLLAALMRFTGAASLSSAKEIPQGSQKATAEASAEGPTEGTISATGNAEPATVETTIVTPLRTTIPATPSRNDDIRRTFEECESELTWLCLKIRFVKLLERLSEPEEFTLIAGVSFVKVTKSREQRTAEIMAEVARGYPNDPHVRLNALIFAKLEQFLRSHYLRVKLLDPATTAADAGSTLVATGRKGGHGHGKKKKKMEKHMEMAIAAIVVMKATLLVVAGAGVAGLAGTALASSLASLAASAYIMVKSMLKSHGNSHKSTSYEIVAKPVYSSSHSQSVVPDDSVYTATGYGGHTASGYAGAFGRSLQLEMPALRHLQEGRFGS